MKRIAVVLGVVALMCSCTLKEDNNSVVSPYNFFKTPAQIRAALNGCYDPLNRIHYFPYFLAVEGTTDLLSTNGSSQKDAKLDINPASPGAATVVWQYCWYGIRYCLSTIAGIDRSEIDTEVKERFRAEAEIVMSYYYYVLTSFFGDVPYYDQYVETDEILHAVAKIGRMSADQTRASLIAKLQLCVPVLDQIRSSDIPQNYCGAAMGWMMIAKMAAWNKEWDTVIDACQHLESIYGDLSQYPYTDVMFRNKNTPESIFEIQHAYEDGGVSYITPNSMAISTAVMPYPKTAGTSIYDGVTIEEIGPNATCYTPLRPTAYCKTYVFPAGTDDVRRDLEMITSWNGVSFGGSRCWLGPKFWCPGLYQNRDNNNYKIFRYADAVLLMAEAYCEKGDYVKSVDYLNMVRQRAHAENYSFQTKVKLRGEIRDERGRELLGEFGRKFDLVRWGIWFDQVLSYNLYNLVQENIRPCHEYYPIPDVQCHISGGVLDNPAYHELNL